MTAHGQSFVFCHLSTTVGQLLFDVIKRSVAHFAPFLASFLLVLTILCFEDKKFGDFFHIRKTYGEVWKTYKETLVEIFAQGVPIMYPVDSCSARSKYHLRLLTHVEISARCLFKG